MGLPFFRNILFKHREGRFWGGGGGGGGRKMSTRVRAGTGDTKLDRIPFPPEHNIHPPGCDSCCRANPCLRLYEYKFLLCYLC